MAQRFLESLPKLPKGQLPSGAECMICKEEYGTVPSDNGTIEHAVLLPCLHHVGSECIAIWLSPGDGLGNSCPLCRTVFFEGYLRDYDDEDDEDGDGYGEGDDSDDEDGSGEGGNDDDGDEDGSDEESDEGDDEGSDSDDGEDVDEQRESRDRSQMFLTEAYLRSASHSVNTRSRDEMESREGQTGPSPPTSQQIDNSEKQAPSHLLPSPPCSIFLPTCSSAQTKSQQQQQPPPSPTKLETQIRNLTSAYRTLAFIQTFLYMILKMALLEARIPGNSVGLSVPQEEMLMWKLGQEGVLSDARGRPLGSMGMTDR